MRGQHHLLGHFVEFRRVEDRQRIFLAVHGAGLQGEINLRHAERHGGDAERAAQQQPFGTCRHAHFHAGEIGRRLHRALLPQIDLPGAEIMRRQNIDAHFRRYGLAVILADRSVEHPPQMVVIAHQITAIEIAQFRNLLRHLEGGHAAHLEIAALDRRHFGALLEQRRGRMHADVETDAGCVDVGLELIERLVEEVRRRRRGRNADLDSRLGLGTASDAERLGEWRAEQGAGHSAGHEFSTRRHYSPPGAADRRDLAQASFAIMTESVPMPAISASIRSPSLRNVPFGTPTPAGVPVRMTSPGSSVMISEARAICSATE